MDTFLKTYTEKTKKTEKKAYVRILVYYKRSENILRVKIAKNYIHADREVYLTGVYNNPKYSNYIKENNCNVINSKKGNN